MYKVKSINAIEILDSRGNPTIYTEIQLQNGSTGSASVPSGASTGKYEAYELRDKDNSRFFGKGVLTAINNINKTISDSICNKEFSQNDLDTTLINLDTTENKQHLGANAILATSLAFADAAAKTNNIPLYQYVHTLSNKSTLSLPIPLMNIINGGQHADNGLAIQEFMIVPFGFETFPESLRAGCEIFHKLKTILHKKSYSTNVGDEGGFAPNIANTQEALDIIMEAIIASNYRPGEQIGIALDAAASSFYKDSMYHISNTEILNSNKLIKFYENLTNNYPILSIEDGMDEDDIDGFKSFTNALGKKIQIVGDDLFVTNPELIKKYASQGLCNAVLIKPNQVGTLTETIEAISISKSFNYNVILSHRSGETEDTKIADFAVGLGSNQIKTGSVSRADRTAKYNQLLKIANNNPSIPFAGIWASKIFNKL